jgi:CheY-like chemotaxis protein
MATILIIEDDTFTASLLSRALGNAGHQVLTAASGDDGIKLARAQRPAVILMDMNLPKMNGWEATRALKADAATRAIPILALTSAGTSGDRDEAYEAGCDAYETKPVDILRLLARVRELGQF